MDAVASRRRWYRLSPGRLILGLLLAEFLLWLSDQLRWPAWHKGYAVLASVGIVGAAMVVLLLWWLAALVFRLRFQFSIRALLLLVVAVAVSCAWLNTDIKRARIQSEATEQIEKLRGNVEYEPSVDRQQEALDNFVRQLERELHHAADERSLWQRMRDRLGRDFFVDVVSIQFSNCGAADADLDRLDAFPRLRELSINDTWDWDEASHCFDIEGGPLRKKSQYGKITDAGLLRLVRFTQLRKLTISGEKITDEGLQPVLAATRLEELDVNSTEVGLTELKSFGQLSQLRILSLWDTNVADAGLRRIAGLSRLQSLSLMYTRITDAGLENLKGHSDLQSLALDCTPIGDAGLANLAGLTGLRDLSLTNTKVTDAGLKNLKGLTRLVSLSLYGTAVTDAGVSELQQSLPNCKIER